MLPISPSTRDRICAPAGEWPSGARGNERVCMGRLLTFSGIIPARSTDTPHASSTVSMRAASEEILAFNRHAWFESELSNAECLARDIERL